MCDLKVGEDAVCVKTHSQGVVKKHEVWPVLALRMGNCKCAKVTVNVGILNEKTASHFTICPGCRTKYPTPELNDGIWWLNASLFRPLDELTDITALTKILEQPVESLFKTNS